MCEGIGTLGGPLPQMLHCLPEEVISAKQLAFGSAEDGVVRCGVMMGGVMMGVGVV